MPESPGKLIVERELIKTIMIIRNAKVVLDSNPAELYGVETRRLKEQVRRNIDKFPEVSCFN